MITSPALQHHHSGTGGKETQNACVVERHIGKNNNTRKNKLIMLISVVSGPSKCVSFGSWVFENNRKSCVNLFSPW